VLQRTYHYILTVVVCCLCTQLAVAQQPGFYVPQKGKIYFSGDTATIFSSVINQGKLGVDKKAVVNFKGRQWQNDGEGIITDEGNQGEDASGTGGIIRFNSTDGRQFIDGGYNAVSKQGATFPNLSIQNSFGVALQNSTAKVRGTLQFINGPLYTQDNTLIIGNGNPGNITGFDAVSYVITGGSGLLVRENIRSGDNWVIFPIGSKENAYTPVAIRSRTTRGDDYHARVQDGVQQNLFSGRDLFSTSVNKTWEIGKQKHPNEDGVDIALQHLVADEGNAFHLNRDHSYISQYTANRWDTVFPQTTPLPGNLTADGSIMPNSGVNTRTINAKISNASYFTKMAGDTTFDKMKLWLSGYRLDYQKVHLSWTVKPEVNVRYYVVQRKLSNETRFTNRGAIVFSRAPNGYSNDYLDYNFDDPNSYSGNSFYRLMIISYQGDTTYSNEIVVGNKPGGLQLLVWPNPTTGNFFVGINNAAAIKYVVVWNAIGQMLHRELVNERSIIPMHLWVHGVYAIGFISHSGQLMETKRLIVIE
jgi:hypothetical protein